MWFNEFNHQNFIISYTGAAVVAFILVVLVVIAIVIFVSITKRNQKNGRYTADVDCNPVDTLFHILICHFSFLNRSLQPTATNAAVSNGCLYML